MDQHKPILAFQVTERLSHYNLTLASSSPRRKEILQRLGVDFLTIPSTFPETLDKSTFAHPSAYVRHTALEKACEVMQRCKHERSVVISGDTIVVLDDRILEKPTSIDDAYTMLRELSGREHSVLTAIAILVRYDDTSKPPFIQHLNEHGTNLPISAISVNPPGCHIISFVEETKVYFADITEDLLKAFIHTGEPMDKAGGYGYQSLAALFIRKIDGCYYNCIGFPLFRVVDTLQTMIAQGVI
ncbi:hypothetical protein BASA50_011057 [Batrachochytrium salamandrivorans]|uniref:Septum formation protein Maf n=1 Tax=Batrachochytrium salamandrivorans TaxID=1357716 RepID=A0ABQ8EWU8_9FUNG|nr:hypothetical protein BASA62_006932 [Batrachochytrium salamandrivorans]KAH6581854.1 hypothetical protein BASA61_008861 [Batrachochytrium salamandrivorans]KAH6587866.1 hypothetical protein BASA50_011057 [Batrachochytrium salamandrivorans]KAH9265330.1 septum formation protein Maf [Batrachochytrium salamandrivorans]